MTDLTSFKVKPNGNVSVFSVHQNFLDLIIHDPKEYG